MNIQTGPYWAGRRRDQRVQTVRGVLSKIIFWMRIPIVAGWLLSTLLSGCFSSQGLRTVLEEEPVLEEKLEPTNTLVLSLPTESSFEPQTGQFSPVITEDYLTNPGIGWQESPEPDDQINFPETVAYSNRRAISWKELNPSRGVYLWDPLDEQLEKAVSQGKQFSFRVYTMVGEEFGSNQVPKWVIEAGAKILSSGEPDYSNCVYQEEWGKFVNKLISRYDGVADIAFIDISGYGNFNEWSWEGTQTKWDDQWEEDYSNNTATGASFRTVDGQARRRLVDNFIGGAFTGHACRESDGSISHVNYSYAGFQKTQLVMPYAGIVQSFQYVFMRRQDIGFRYDCLGRQGQVVYNRIGNELQQIWMKAPIIYELCKPYETDPQDAAWLLQKTHASLVHDNQWSYSREELESMLFSAGYRYFLKEVDYTIVERNLELNMRWQNLGLAPNYPRMGQKFSLYLYLLDRSGKIAFKETVLVDITSWLPSSSSDKKPKDYLVFYQRDLPSSLSAGKYAVGVSILNQRTGLPIQLAMDERDEHGINILFDIEIK
jgi:hypothetical protein